MLQICSGMVKSFMKIGKTSQDFGICAYEYTGFMVYLNNNFN